MEDFFEVLCKIVGIALVIVCLIAVILWLIAGVEAPVWNKLHGTSYTQSEWFGGSDFIEKYHYPDRDKTAKYEVNVNG